MSHTPGPWSFGESRYDFTEQEELTNIYANGNHVATAHEVWDGDDKSNARLIAAAPEMLEALNRLNALIDFSAEWATCDCFSEPDQIQEACAQAQAAIDSATGESR